MVSALAGVASGRGWAGDISTSAGLSIRIVTQDIVAATEWETFSYTEQIGQPDTDERRGDRLHDGSHLHPAGAGPVRGPRQLFLHDRSARARPNSSPGSSARSACERMPPARCATPEGGRLGIPRREAAGGPAGRFHFPHPGGTATRTAAHGDRHRFLGATQSPTIAGVTALWTAYWNSPWPLDLTTYVSEIVPVPASVDQVSWSGSDLDGAMNDLCAAGSAVGDVVVGRTTRRTSSRSSRRTLALHFGLVILPIAG